MHKLRNLSEDDLQVLVQEMGKKEHSGYRMALQVFYLEKYPEVYLKSIEWGDLLENKNHEYMGKLFKFRGSISDLLSPEPYWVEEEKRQVTIQRMRVRQKDGAEINIVPVASGEFITRIQSLWKDHQFLDFYGTVVPTVEYTANRKRVKSQSFDLLLLAIEPSNTPLQMVRATRKEISETEKKLEQLTKNNRSVFDYLKENVIREVGLKGIDEAELLEAGVDFAIIQAFSQGSTPNGSTSLKLHSLIIGAPGSGKKLLVESAKILNPVKQEVQPSKMTVAGLGATAVPGKGGVMSKPGKIPLANGGVLVSQDFHRVVKRGEIMDVLSMVMEDGRFIDGSSANTTHQSFTSIHLDMNRLSDLYPGRKSNGHRNMDELKVATNGLTRFDFIVDIPPDMARQRDTVSEMLKGEKVSGNADDSIDQDPEVRKLKLIVAYLRTQYSAVTIPEELSNTYIEPGVNQLFDEYPDLFKEDPEASIFLTRMAISSQKFAYAIARLNQCSVVTQDHVDEAFRMIRVKIRTLRQLLAKSPDQKPNQSAKEIRQSLIRDTFSGQLVTCTQVQEFLEKETKTFVSKDTVNRDLKELGEREKHGQYRIGKKQDSRETSS